VTERGRPVFAGERDVSRFWWLVAAILVTATLAPPAAVLASSAVSTRAEAPAPNAVTDGPNLLFVHAWKAPADEEAVFTEFLDPLNQAYPGRVSLFEYYQDAIRQGQSSCEGVRAEPSPDPTAGMPAPERPGTNYCDSESDVAYNVVLLHQRVQALYAASEGQPLILIGNSLGATIIRGLLSYSADLGDGVATTMVDSVVFLECAMDGSHFATMAIQSGGVLCLLQPPQCGLVDSAETPAVKDFAALSAWYQWANPGEERLSDNLPAFNMFGDIQPSVCFLWTDACVGVGVSLGDGLLPPGTDDPFDVAFGGARFLDGELDEQRWQWPMGDRIKVMPPFSPAIDVVLNPAFHANFESNMDEIMVKDCWDFMSTAQITALEQAWRVVRGRMDGEPYLCDPSPQGQP
jgi:hypothetical protein